MDWQDHIEKVPGILSGKPVIKGTRIPVELIVGRLNGGAWSEADLITGYGITTADLDACRQFAATGEPLSPTTWAEFEAAVFGDADGRPANLKA